MFKETLEAVLANLEDGLGVLIMGLDGISVEKILRPEGEAVNLDVAAAEVASLVRNTQRLGRNIGLDGLQELTLRFEKIKILVQMVGQEYFLILALQSEGNIGRARYQLRKAELELAREFSF